MKAKGHLKRTKKIWHGKGKEAESANGAAAAASETAHSQPEAGAHVDGVALREQFDGFTPASPNRVYDVFGAAGGESEEAKAGVGDADPFQELSSEQEKSTDEILADFISKQRQAVRDDSDDSGSDSDQSSWD